MTPRTKSPHLPALETQRLVLRSIGPSDAALFQAVYGDPLVASRCLREPCESPEEASRIVRSIQEAARRQTSFRWAFVERRTGKTIGAGGFHDWRRKPSRAQISYELAPACRGVGFATEGAAVLVSFGLVSLNLKSILAHIHPENAESIRVIERLGFDRGPDVERQDPAGRPVVFSTYVLGR